MIVIRVIGGLGNQMFQYAAGKALAMRHGVPLALDLGGFSASDPRNTPRPFLLDRLHVPEAAASMQLQPVQQAEANFTRARWKARVDRLLGKVGLPKLSSSPNEYREPHFHYDPAFEALGPRTALFGYFPGRRLGWLEDTPQGVVHNWARAGVRFDASRHRGGPARAEMTALMRPFSAVTAATLALSVTDDEFGTVPAIERLLRYYPRSPATHLRIAPASIAQPRIGHFAFFNSRHEGTLWPIALEWLRHGRCGADTPGAIVPRTRASDAVHEA